MEYTLWHAVVNGPRKYGRLDINEHHISTLKSLSSGIDGWVYFSAETEETYIPMSSWVNMYRENLSAYASKIS